MKYIVLIVAAVFCTAAFGYSSSLFNLYSPAPGIDGGNFEFSMNHRFFGNAFKDDPLNSLFGLDDGANVRFGLQYFIYDGISLGLSHTRLGHANTITSSWNKQFSPIDMEVGVLAGYTSVKPGTIADREGGLLATLSISAWTPHEIVKPVVNYIVDDYEDENGFGLGLEIKVTGKFSLIGEYFPYSGEADMNDVFSFGTRYSTWGHQFLLGFSNSSAIGPQGQLAGSSDNDLSFALSIRRLL